MYNLLGNLIENYWWGGGGGAPAPPHPFILQNCVVRYIRGLFHRDSTVCNFALLRRRVKEKGKADFHCSSGNKCKKCLTGQVRFKIGRVMTA